MLSSADLADLLRANCFFAAFSKNVTLNSTLIDEQYTCIDDPSVKFTCVTTGSTVLIWRSNDFIGADDTDQFLFISNRDGEGLTRRIRDSVATLTRNEIVNGQRVLESTLHITVMSSTPNTSVTCVNVDDDSNVTKYFTVPCKCVC